MVDAPDRPVPRFPQEAVRRIAAAIDQILDRWDVGPGSVVLTQGARGTDILVAESALRRGARVRLFLALPPAEFEARSVSLPGSDWSKRFQALLDRCEVIVQAEAIGAPPAGESPFARNNRWVLGEAARLAEQEKVPFRVLVVWDQSETDGAGGTADFAAAAEQHGVSLGYSVREIQDLYRELAPKIFRKRFYPARIRSLYKDRSLSRQLEGFLGPDTTLGSDEIRSLLLVVMHRIDTDSIWPLSNNSRAKYNDRSRPDCNLNFPLSKVVRGSTAAPVYFMPETIQVGARKAYFQDGGVTPFNNPALLLFEMATSPRYRLGWPEGADRLLLVSVGTGFAASTHEQLKRSKVTLLFQAKNLVKVIMNGSSTENDRLCRVLGGCRHGDPIDSEFDADNADVRPPDTPLFSYIRYNADISANGLSKVDLGHIDPKRIARLDALAAMEDLTAVGRKAAEHVELEHFDGFSGGINSGGVTPAG